MYSDTFSFRPVHLWTWITTQLMGEGWGVKNTSKTQPVILKQPAANCTSRLIKATGKLLPADFLQISPVIPHELWHYCLTTQPQINPQTPPPPPPPPLPLASQQSSSGLHHASLASWFQCLYIVFLISSKVPLLFKCSLLASSIVTSTVQHQNNFKRSVPTW